MIFDLIAKVLSKNATGKEQKKYMKSPSPESKRIEELWQATGKLKPTLEQKAKWEKSAQAFKDSLGLNGAGVKQLHPQKNLTKSRVGYYTLRIAATIVIVLSSAFAISQVFFLNIEISTKNAERKTVELPDRSTVELNASTNLTFPKSFSNKLRNVRLKGETFFKVIFDRRPFVVKTGSSIIQTLEGTFNIRSRENSTVVAVELGQVIFRSLDKPGQVLLEEGEFSKIVDGNKPTIPQKANLDNHSLWREGGLWFEETQLNEVFRELSRHFDVKFKVLVDHFGNELMTAKFNKEITLEAILEKISSSFGFKIKKSDDEFQIFDEKN